MDFSHTYPLSTGNKQPYLFLPATNGGCPIQAVFWLEWDSTDLNR
jgi:hypothetical protein